MTARNYGYILLSQMTDGGYDMNLYEAAHRALASGCGIRRAWWQHAEVFIVSVSSRADGGYAPEFFAYGEPWRPSAADVIAEDWELTPARPERPADSYEPMRKRAVEEPPRRGLSKLALAVSILSLALAMLSLLLR